MSENYGDELYDGASLSSAGDPGEEPENLLTMPSEQAAEELVDLWTGLDPLMRHRLACWEVNQLRRDGYVNVRVLRRQDSAQYAVYPPPERRGQPLVHSFNKARQLCRTFVGNLLADPPAPIVEPTSDADDDTDAAEITQRALEDIQSPGQLDTGGAIRQALDRACTYGSGFVRYYVDPAKGGRVPKTIKASPLATDARDPLLDPQTGEPFGSIVMGMDPMTGQPIQQRQEPPAPIDRFVTPDGQLTDNKAEADYVWRPGLCREVLDGRHVRFLPWGSDRQSADCVLMATYITLREARRLASAYGETLTKEQIKKLTAFRPEQGDYLLPEDRRSTKDRTGDETLVFCLTGVWKETPEYEDGLYITVLGDALTLYRDTWIAHVRDNREALPLPIAQVKQWENGRNDPYGDGMMDDLGGANEVRAAQIGHLMEYLDMWNNMPVVIPSTSTITEGQLYSKRVLSIMPGQEPRSIKPPGYESASLELFQLTGTEMDGASHLQQAAQGVEDPSVQSGRHAFQIIAQVHAQLSEPKQHVEQGYLQASEIELALTRGFNLTGDTRWQGEDGEYKYERWVGANLSGDIRLKPGTMTMLAPGAKAELIERWMGANLIDPDTAQTMLAHNVSASLGRWDDPYLLEIKRSIAKWEQGPPQGWAPPPPPQQIGVQPVQGVQGPELRPVMSPPQPDPVALAIFPPKPVHSLPLVAKKRLEQLGRTMAGLKYERQPPEWQAVLNAEYAKMQQALMPAPAPPGAQATAQPEAPKGAVTPNPNEPPSPANPTLDPQRRTA